MKTRLKFPKTKKQQKTTKAKDLGKETKAEKAFNQEYDDKGEPTDGFFEELKKVTEAIAARYKRYRGGMYLISFFVICKKKLRITKLKAGKTATPRNT